MTAKSSADSSGPCGTERVRKYPFLPRDPEVGWIPYVWLVYLVWFLVYPWVDHQARRFAVDAIVQSAIFLPLYFWAHWIKGHRVLWISAAMFVLAVIAAPVNPAAGVFVVFAAAFIGSSGTPAFAVRCLVVLMTCVALQVWLQHIGPSYWITVAVFAPLVGAVRIFSAQRIRMNRRLHMAQEEVERIAKIAERERIARDLHDLLGHTLSLIALKSELATKLTESDPERAAREIADVHRISREALVQVRAAVRGFRSAGLASEADHARATLETAGVQFDCKMDRISLPPAEESVLVLALREAVTNIVRHAGARSCTVRLVRSTVGVELLIADDGRGGDAPEGSGLSGMRERVESLGGSLERDARVGTRLVLRIPIEGAASSDVA